MTKEETEKDQVRNQVRERYAGFAKSEGACCCDSSTMGNLGNASASSKLGYSSDEMSTVPDGSNMGLGCGNPGVIAALKEGETVLDLGCGGGFDCFLAAPKVGETGKVIGVDMTSEMLSKARANAEQGGYENVEFRLGEIEHLPVADDSVDVIMSNCVINLSADKERVYREAFRVSRKGGRIVVSDVVMVKPIPEGMTDDGEMFCGCVGGALAVPELERILRDVGFERMGIDVKENSGAFIRDWFPGSGVENYVLSADIKAIKPNHKHERSDEMEERTKELIAIGASVAGHCQPCLTYHATKARELGIDDEDVREAISVGHMVEKGAMSAMREFVKSVTAAEPQAAPSCCGGTPPRDDGKCCE